MLQKMARVLIFSAILLAVCSVLFARTLEKKEQTDPVFLLKQEHQKERENQLKEIADLMEIIRGLEEELLKLNGELNNIKASKSMTRDILDRMHVLVKEKENLEKDLAKEEKSLSEKQKDLKDDDEKRLDKVNALKAKLKKDARKERASELKDDLRKYENIISSPSVKNMDIKKSAWMALAIKYPKEAKGVEIGDTEELTFRIKYGGITNSIGMKFVLVQAGSFRMGSPDDESFRSNDELRHKVIIKQSYYLQATEVTQGQWVEIMGTKPWQFKTCGKDCPVENVSWDDCQEFIRKLNQREGMNKYRLPTEAEWEYACRAGRSSAFTNGAIDASGCDIDPNLDQMGWYCGNAWRTIHPVSEKKANGWGLYDMHGNVWEWCQDWYGPYSKNTVTDPKGAQYGPKRVIRGGSFRNHAEKCRSAFRFAYKTNVKLDHLGFRIARTK